MSSSPTVIVLSQVPPPVHGSTVMTLTLVTQLRQAGWHVKLVDRRFSKEIGQVGRWSLKKIFAAPSLLTRMILAVRGNPDAAVIFLSSSTGAFISDFLSAVAAVMARVPIILYLHTTGFARLSQRSRVFLGAIKWVVRKSAATVTLGARMSDDIRSIVPDAPLVHIPNAVDVPAGTARSVQEQTVTFLSNLLPEKGALDFVACAARIFEMHPRVRFVVAGAYSDPDHTRHVESTINEHHLEHALIMRGAVLGQAKWELLADSTVLVFPSRYPREAQPLTVIEAMRAGVPVVAYDVGGLSDLIDQSSGALVAAGDIDGLVSAVDRILSSPTQLESFRRGALRRSQEHHSLDAYRKRWHALLESIQE